MIGLISSLDWSRVWTLNMLPESSQWFNIRGKFSHQCWYKVWFRGSVGILSGKRSTSGRRWKDCQSSVFRFVAVVGQRIVVLELKLVFIPSNWNRLKDSRNFLFFFLKYRIKIKIWMLSSSWESQSVVETHWDSPLSRPTVCWNTPPGSHYYLSLSFEYFVKKKEESIFKREKSSVLYMMRPTCVSIFC